MAEPKKLPITKEISVSIEDLIGKLKPDEIKEITYANFARVIMTNYELFVDFFSIIPNPSGKMVAIDHISRIALPQGLAKGLATALANNIAEFEADREIVLPNSRTPQPEDRITIWP